MMVVGVRTEDRYHIVKHLYLIRNQYPRMGLFQPDFICIAIGKYFPSKFQRSNADIKDAVKLWCTDRMTATIKYGDIGKWDTWAITSMKNLFNGHSFGGHVSKQKFNDDISNWDVSNVTDMSQFAYNAKSFQGLGDMNKWNVSNVTNMNEMFANASSFIGNISKWNVSSVTDMASMFQSAISFNSNISEWNTCSVNEIQDMFLNANKFNQEIGRWDVSNVSNMEGLFCNATNFNGNISKWNLKSMRNADEIFTGCNIEYDHVPTELRMYWVLLDE